MKLIFAYIFLFLFFKSYSQNTTSFIIKIESVNKKYNSYNGGGTFLIKSLSNVTNQYYFLDFKMDSLYQNICCQFGDIDKGYQLFLKDSLTINNKNLKNDGSNILQKDNESFNIIIRKKGNEYFVKVFPVILIDYCVCLSQYGNFDMHFNYMDFGKLLIIKSYEDANVIFDKKLQKEVKKRIFSLL